MRKHTARHWLHAALDLLPVLLIPVFMIYSHRHDLSTDITIQQDVYKDFYQYVKNGNFNDGFDYWTDELGTLYSVSNNIATFDYEFDTNNYFDYQLNANDKIFIKFKAYDDTYINSDNNLTLTLMSDDYDYFADFDLSNDTNFKDYIFNINDNFTMHGINFYGNGEHLISFTDIQLFNLTEIFGSGNEPTKEVFESYLIQDYYDFGNNEVKVGTTQVPVKNNDIMSVFMDSFNNSVNKYFNMGNVFGLGNVYQWFNVNVFGGNAPQVIYSVYNIVIYELVMDLLFLLYALFMWFIDMLKRLIEKPLDSIK